MSINSLTENIPFGVSSPAYRSRSTGTDFEEIIMQIREDLKVAGMDSLFSSTQTEKNPTLKKTNLLSVPQLFKMKPEEFSLLDELLLTALEETKNVAQKSMSGISAGENNLKSQASDPVHDRYIKSGT